MASLVAIGTASAAEKPARLNGSGIERPNVASPVPEINNGCRLNDHPAPAAASTTRGRPLAPRGDARLGHGRGPRTARSGGRVSEQVDTGDIAQQLRGPLRDEAPEGGSLPGGSWSSIAPSSARKVERRSALSTSSTLAFSWMSVSVYSRAFSTAMAA